QINAAHPSQSPHTDYQYDNNGNLRFVIDPLGHTTERVYDAANRLTDVSEPDPDGTGPLASPHTHYAYDDAGRLLSLTDPVGNVTTWHYDTLGHVKQETNQFGASRYFNYDAANRLVS